MRLISYRISNSSLLFMFIMVFLLLLIPFAICWSRMSWSYAPNSEYNWNSCFMIILNFWIARIAFDFCLFVNAYCKEVNLSVITLKNLQFISSPRHTDPTGTRSPTLSPDNWLSGEKYSMIRLCMIHDWIWSLTIVSIVPGYVMVVYSYLHNIIPTSSDYLFTRFGRIWEMTELSQCMGLFVPWFAKFSRAPH